MTPITVPLGSPAVSGQLVNVGGRITWFTLREISGGNPAVVRLYDGSGVSGKLVATIALQAAESTRDWVGHQGVPFDGGLYLEVVQGTVEGAVVYVPETDWLENAMPVIVVADLSKLVG